ncbi:ATP-grasp domain-containing protein [Peribacillus simplex]|uniref:ATP-grasp domain-containing protein n=1 Tax=Peribacillus simplex TaxID=1478 RepID=UPI0024C178ED|nr:ATP-grasp domain-containing protein [Peribacillus simplex]WHY55225.1 ATP-grasp domain-containing protein [Peribacillus simplex]
MKKVLILGVASVQMDAILQLKEMGIKTYACAQADDGPGSKFADQFELINFVDEDKVIELLNEQEIDCVYSVGSDIAMPVSTAISEKMSLPYFVKSEIARICNNKNKMRDYFGKDFLGNIKYQTLESINEKVILDYPFIMKPSDSQGQRGVRLINNFDEFLVYFEESKTYSRSGLVIIEEFITGPELSVNAYIVDGDVAFMVTSDREVWSEYQGGLIHKHVVPSRVTNSQINNNLIDLVSRTAKKLGVTNGPLYFQIKLSDNLPYIIEVTPRLDGCHMWNLLKHYTGVNLIKLTFEHLLFGKTEELQNFKHSSSEYILEFVCEEPNTIVDNSKYDIPSNALSSMKYYNNGDLIRPINGQFEKIGYFITENDR